MVGMGLLLSSCREICVGDVIYVCLSCVLDVLWWAVVFNRQNYFNLIQAIRLVYCP
jgi:hypothetical protein